MLISLDFTTLVADIIERLIGSDGSPYKKRMNAKGLVLSDECIADEVPFEELPEGWCWARLSNVASIQLGKMLDKQKNQGELVPYLGNANVQWGKFDLANVKSMPMGETDRAKFALSEGDLIVCEGGVPGRCAIWASNETMHYQKALHRIRCDKRLLLNTYCELYICFIVQSHVWDSCFTGTTIKHLPAQTLSNWLIPLPPLAEQRRIVKRVDGLMPLIEEYGALEDAREALDAVLPGRLRKSVLQLAVRGGLAPQNPADEPAGVLLERIRGRRRQLVAEGKMKAPRGGESVIFAGSDGRRYEKRIDAKGRESEPVCIEGEIPFEIPRGWEWARLESVTIYIQRGKSPKYSTVEKYPVIAQKCNQWSGFSVEKARFIDPATVSKYADERVLKDGDLLWNSTGLGTLGRMAVYDSTKNRYGWAVADSHVTVIRTREDWLDHRFAFAYFAGPSVQSVIEDQASGSTKQKELAQETVKNYLVPIPPLAEQHRIVNRVNRLFKTLT